MCVGEGDGEGLWLPGGHGVVMAWRTMARRMMSVRPESYFQRLSRNESEDDAAKRDEDSQRRFYEDSDELRDVYKPPLLMLMDLQEEEDLPFADLPTMPSTPPSSFIWVFSSL